MDAVAHKDPTDVARVVSVIAPEVPGPVGLALERILTSMEPSGPLGGRLDTLERLAH